MKVVGTAGHVDHGKSALVKVLTGVDPDRLKEEKAREMTIELGFAWFNLPNGEPVSIVDVPGHGDFVENMLAGAGVLDAVLFVIAADEGVMPQTKEHLAILDMLAVQTGIIALTKSDLISDNEWLSIVKNDIRTLVKNTFLENVPIVPVSSKNGTGISDLTNKLQEVLTRVTDRQDSGRPRMGIDRVFSIHGFGTVVTGTLIGGVLTIGDSITILPSGKKGRIRGLQSHNLNVKKIFPGSRTAINLAGLEKTDLHRGDLVTTMDDLKPSCRFDVFMTATRDAHFGIRHNEEIKIFHLTSERMAKIRILGKDWIKPGESGYGQIELIDPLPVERMDRLVLRRPSPAETVGGGIVLNTNVSRRYHHFSEKDLYRVMAIHSGTPQERILALFSERQIQRIKDIFLPNVVSREECLKLLGQMVHNGTLIDLSPQELSYLDKEVISSAGWKSKVEQIQKILRIFHQDFPLRLGASQEELYEKLDLERAIFDRVLEKSVQLDLIKEENGYYHLPEFMIKLSGDHIKKLRIFNNEWNKNPYSPPGEDVAKRTLGEELLRYLVDSRQVSRILNNVIFRQQEMEEMLEFVTKTLKENCSISIQEFRDHFGTTRKYALAYLEHLDRTGVTIRDGDRRKFR